jgi:Ran GTPase-activating protein (RanGAP) involved in mRNA processing and transport
MCVRNFLCSLTSAGFEIEGEKQQKQAASWTHSLNIFVKKKDAAAANIYKNFKRMILEVEARNLILDKILYETERDSLKEFRIAHPPLFPCPHCEECFQSQVDLTLHVANTEIHQQKQKEASEKLLKFIPVDNVLLGPFGRKLIAHRLLFSIELNGLQSRLDVVRPQPYRPNISDIEGKRAEQLRQGTFVLGSDPRSGIRPLYDQRHLDRQHRQTWGQEQNSQLSLQDTMTYLSNTHDQAIDAVFTTGVSCHIDVSLHWRGYIRFTVLIMGEFNGWRPTSVYPNDMGKYVFTISLAPGRYQYRWIADGTESIEPTSSSMIGPDGKTNNVILVLNPYQNDPHLLNPTTVVQLPTQINIRNSYLYTDGAWALAECIQKSNSHILSFDLSHNHISDEGMMAIAQACTHLTKLETLKLNDNSFTFDGVRYLTSVYSSSLTLKRLELCDNRIGNDGAELLAKMFSHHSSLQEVFLDSNHIGNDGAKELALAIQSNNTIEVLSLASNQIRTEGMERLCYHLRYNGCLKVLNISQNPLGPEGGKYVGEMLLFNNTLRVLNVSHVQLVLNKQLQGLLSITEGIKRNKGLHTILMKGNSLNNDHALDIAFGLSHNHTLRTVDLGDNPIVSQWFQPNTYLKTKLLAKMPTIRTSLDRNKKILEDDTLRARFLPVDPVMDTEHEGQWNRRRVWKVPKKSRQDHGSQSDAQPHEDAILPESTPGNPQTTDQIPELSQTQLSKRLSVEEEEKRIKAEDTYVSENLYKYAVTLTIFLNSPDGKITLKYLSKLILIYFQNLYKEKSEREEWIEEVQWGILTELLLFCEREHLEKEKILKQQQELQQIQLAQLAEIELMRAEENQNHAPESGKKKKEKKKSKKPAQIVQSSAFAAVEDTSQKKENKSASLSNQYRSPEQEALLKTVVPPSAHEEYHQTVSRQCIDLFFQKVHVHLLPNQIQEIVDQCLVQKPQSHHHRHHHPASPQPDPTPSTEISVQEFIQYFISNSDKYFLTGFTALFRQMLHSIPTSLATELIYNHHINERRIYYRQQFRNDKTRIPLYYCQVCGKRYPSERSFKKHGEKTKKDHQIFFLKESLWLSQDKLINLAKTKQVGVLFPAYYILGDMRLMPQYFTPQVYDDLGDEGRPIGVIEPDLTYRVNDLLGIWIQVTSFPSLL